MTDNLKIPPTWAHASLGSITLPVAKIDQRISPSRRIRYVDISGIDNKNFRIETCKELLLQDAPSRARQIIQSGDILFSTVRPYLKNIAQVPVEYDGEIASTGFAVLRPSEVVNPHYLFFHCLSRSFVNSLSEDQYGVSYPAVNDEQVREKLVPLPPLNEQRRIVAKIEELFSELDKAVECLKTAREQLKVYRQALLKHAFEGKLTEQWRRDNADKLETADELLARIQREREARYEAQVAEWKEAVKRWEAEGRVGKKPGKPKLVTSQSFPASDLGPVDNLPHGWTWLRFSDLIYSVRGGTTVPPVDTATDFPILRSSSIRNGVIDYSDVRYLKPGTVKSKSDFVTTGDLLFSRLNGSIEFVGNCAMVRGDFPANLLYPDRLYCVKLIDDDLSLYTEYYFTSPSVRRLIEEKAKSTAGHKRISIPDITELAFPLPSSAEAICIATQLDEKVSIIAAADKELDQNLAKCEALRQSILKKAFSGQLVPQDPDDEPAGVLLERIAAEKAARAGEKGTKAKAGGRPAGRAKAL